MLTHFSLCSGIGGLDLAAEWAGFKTVAQCELNEYASKVLEKNFKGVYNFGDIRTVSLKSYRDKGIATATVISAGFPCQPYSLAGHGLGASDSRDLWDEVARIIGEFKPTWFIGENTPGLFQRKNQKYFRRILSDLAKLGYNVSWGIWGASDVGAVHQRERVFIIAHSMFIGCNSMDKNFKKECTRMFTPLLHSWTSEQINSLFCLSRKIPKGRSGVLRNDNGLSEGMDRVRCLGNAVVPQQAYPIFKAIAEIENIK
jgi:DNA (cytosine-5)-methyltransferase 1